MASTPDSPSILSKLPMPIGSKALLDQGGGTPELASGFWSLSKAEKIKKQMGQNASLTSQLKLVIDSN